MNGEFGRPETAYGKQQIDIMAKTVADLLVEVLADAGTRRIYGVSGDSLNGITDPIRVRRDIQWVHVRHEETAAFAAGAEAHLTGNLAVCAGSCGPGNLHLINGLYDCHRNRVPVLAIAACIFDNQFTILFVAGGVSAGLCQQSAETTAHTSSKVTHLNSLPQGQPQRDQRTLSMVAGMRNELFGSCTNHGECEAVCPKQIPIEFIGKLNRDLTRALWHSHREPLTIPGVVQLPSVEDAHEHFHDDIRPSQEVARRPFQEDVPAHSPVESLEHAGALR
jgi:hypothetical protein